MSLTKAERKILAFTNEEFYIIISEKFGYLFYDFELLFIKLPEDLEELTKSIAKKASDEMA